MARLEWDPTRSEPNGRNRVVLVSPSGTALGESSKLEAHEPPGQLHLAFSVFLYDPTGRLLLQRRAASKYHFPLVWANSCCSHPAPGEEPLGSAEARVREELGLNCSLRPAGHFLYRASCPDSGLVEHEYDLVFVGVIDAVPAPDPAEVAELRFVEPDSISAELLGGPLAPWFDEALALATEALR